MSQENVKAVRGVLSRPTAAATTWTEAGPWAGSS
jgi:hypothetical protein